MVSFVRQAVSFYLSPSKGCSTLLRILTCFCLIVIYKQIINKASNCSVCDFITTVYDMVRESLLICIVITFCHNVLASNGNEIEVVVRADVTWEMADIITGNNTALSWFIDRNDFWSFNNEVFHEGHGANGVEGMPAVAGYMFFGENIVKLIGRIGASGRISSIGNNRRNLH